MASQSHTNNNTSKLKIHTNIQQESPSTQQPRQKQFKLPTRSPSEQTQYELHAIIKKGGYSSVSLLAPTLQGFAYRAISNKTGQKVIIKTASKHLVSNKMSKFQKKPGELAEDFLKEIQIMTHIHYSFADEAKKHLIKFLNAFESHNWYFLIMEDGGTGLFEFAVTAHKLLKHCQITIQDYHVIVKKIFNQMIHAISSLHKNNLCHFDISLENFVIDGVKFIENKNSAKTFTINHDNLVVKLIDFGLTELFTQQPFLCQKYCGKKTYFSPELTARIIYKADKNDVFCLGVCFFMLLIGAPPYSKAAIDDTRFHYLLKNKVNDVLYKWNKLMNVNDDIIELINAFFKYEDKRITIEQLKNNKWLAYSAN